MKHLAVLNKFFIRYKWRLLLGLIFVSLSNYFRVLQPQMIREALDLVIDSIQLNQLTKGFDLQEAIFSQLGRSLLLFGGLVLLFAILMGVFMYFMRQTIIVVSRLVEYDMRKELFAHYELLDTAFYKRNNTGDLMARISEDVSKVRMYIGPAVLYGINLVSLFIFVIYSMLSVNPQLTLYCLAPLPLLSVSIYYVSNLINRRSSIIQAQLSVLNSTAQESYSGIRVLKSYVQEASTGTFFADQCEEYKDKSMDLAKVNAAFHPLMLLLIGASTIITVYVGGLQVAKGTITPGNIAEFVIYVNMLTWPVTAIGWIASIIQQASASQERINEFLETIPDISNTNNDPIPIKGAIAFDQVHFTYPDTGIMALKNISFSLNPGEKLAIVGRTGSGKTTIAELLTRMYDATEGQIRIDNKPIQSLDLANLRQRIGYVPQDVFLFSDSIANNITFGKAEASTQEIEQHAKYAAVFKDIDSLPDRFETLVGERGVTLSGGQKQRISIARALIKDPDIVLLDDCLSAVDAKTEQEILSYLNTSLKDKTTIIITHRFSTYFQFDKIIVLDEGTLAEQGTHEELMSMKGIYFDLFENQRKEEADV